MGIADELGATFATTGRIEWIGLSAERRSEIREVERVRAVEGTGLEGDHHASGGRSKRQVSLIQAEHLPLIASFSSNPEVHPATLRRNVVVSGINLRALKEKRFRIGDALLEGSGECPPCSRMEAALGPGGWNAMRGHGGITARVIDGGAFGIGDEVLPVDRENLELA